MNYGLLSFISLIALYGVSGLVLPSNPDVPFTIDDVLDDPGPDDDSAGDNKV